MFFIFGTQFLGEYLGWDVTIWYFDLIMHFWGGVWVTLFFIYIFSMLRPVSLGPWLILAVAFCTLAVGIAWELYEFLLNVISLTPFDAWDTALDIVFDFLGSLAAIFFYFKIIMPIPRNRVE